MRALRWFLFGGVGVLILFLAGGMLLPGEIEVEESIVIDVPAPLVHRAVSDFELWQQWEPWGPTDETMAVTYGETRRGVGASYRWSGERTGTGEIEILEDSPAVVRYRYVFNDNAEDPAFASIALEPLEAESTAVTWTFLGEVGLNPIDRYLILLVRPMIEDSYQRGLASLKRLLEEGESRPAEESDPAP